RCYRRASEASKSNTLTLRRRMLHPCGGAMKNPIMVETEMPPVRVVEKIPVDATSELSPATAAAEKIPTPAHLSVAPALARGGMGHVHPAVDRNLLRSVAMKRLDKGYATEPFYRDAFIAEG